MQSKDLISTSGYLQIHVSFSDHNTCYIFINNILNNELKMKWFTNYKSAMAWINSM